MTYKIDARVFTISGASSITISFHFNPNNEEKADGYKSVFRGPVLFAPRIQGEGEIIGSSTMTFFNVLVPIVPTQVNSEEVMSIKYIMTYQNDGGNPVLFQLTYGDF
jgi:hypothetical protein